MIDVLTVCKSLLKRISVVNPTRINIGKRLNQARTIPSISPGEIIRRVWRGRGQTTSSNNSITHLPCTVHE